MIVTDIEIRRAGADDWPALWEIVREVFARGDTYAYPIDTSEEEARRIWLERPQETYVAAHDGAAVGTYYLKPNQPVQGRHVCNAGYMVSREARGRGLGRALCEHSLREARRLGYSAMQYKCLDVRMKIWPLETAGVELLGSPSLLVARISHFAGFGENTTVVPSWFVK